MRIAEKCCLTCNLLLLTAICGYLDVQALRNLSETRRPIASRIFLFWLLGIPTLLLVICVPVKLFSLAVFRGRRREWRTKMISQNSQCYAESCSNACAIVCRCRAIRFNASLCPVNIKNYGCGHLFCETHAHVGLGMCRTDEEKTRAEREKDFGPCAGIVCFLVIVLIVFITFISLTD